MSLTHSPAIVTNGLVFYYDMNNTSKSWKGAPVTNSVPNADTMSGWSAYYRTTAAPAFTTEFLTTGYRLVNQPSWNGVSRGITLPSTGTYTFSAWFRYNGGSTSNNGATVYIAGWGGTDSAAGIDKSKVGVWQRVSLTLTCTNTNISFYLISYGGTDNGTGNPDWSSWDVTMPQIEPGTFATPFVAGTRSNTQALLDLTATSTITANSLTYASDNTFSFTGTSSNNMTVSVSNVSANGNSRSWDAWVKPTTSQVTAGLFGHVLSSGCSYYCNGGVCIASSNYQFNWYDNASYQFLDSGVVATSGTWAHITGTWNGSDNKARIYVNGVLKNTGSASNLNYGGAVNLIQIGYLSASGNYFTGNIANIKHYYNKVLSDSEVLQNFNALRGRYGL